MKKKLKFILIVVIVLLIIFIGLIFYNKYVNDDILDSNNLNEIVVSYYESVKNNPENKVVTVTDNEMINNILDIFDNKNEIDLPGETGSEFAPELTLKYSDGIVKLYFYGYDCVLYEDERDNTRKFYEIKGSSNPRKDLLRLIDGNLNEIVVSYYESVKNNPENKVVTVTDNEMINKILDIFDNKNEIDLPGETGSEFAPELTLKYSDGIVKLYFYGYDCVLYEDERDNTRKFYEIKGSSNPRKDLLELFK